MRRQQLTPIQLTTRDIINVRRLIISRRRRLINEDDPDVNGGHQASSKLDLVPVVQELIPSVVIVLQWIHPSDVTSAVSSFTFKLPVLLPRVNINTDGTSLHMPTVTGLLMYIILVVLTERKRHITF